VVSAEGQPAQAVIDDLLARTPEVLAQVRAQLPSGFPAEVADSIFTGVEEAATRLAA
jgi:serine/threonine-protein kinase HipA